MRESHNKLQIHTLRLGKTVTSFETFDLAQGAEDSSSYRHVHGRALLRTHQGGLQKRLVEFAKRKAFKLGE
jgi:hypothetical protein